MEKTSRAIIIDENGLMTFYREKVINGKKECYYAIPGGHVEDGETPEETVIRELKEELNIDIEIIRYLDRIIIGNRCEDYYLCKKISGEPVLGGEELLRNNEDNYYEFRYYPLDKIDESGIMAMDIIKSVL